MKSAWSGNGDTLYVLTYHEIGEGTPLFFQQNGIGTRAMDGYYGMPMGGAIANGNDAGSINLVQTSVFDGNPIPQDASFEFSSEVSSSDPKTVAITVNATAKANIPDGVKLHILVTEKKIVWEDTWPEGVTENTVQKMIYDVIWDIIGDTLGNDFPSIAAGASHSMTHNFTLTDGRGQNADSLEVTAVLQVNDTKKILAVSRMAGSPFASDGNPITSSSLMKKMGSLSLNISGNKLSFKLPFNKTEVSLFNTSGRMLSKQNLNGNKGSMVSLNLPEAKGLLLMKLRSIKGEVFTQSLILK